MRRLPARYLALRAGIGNAEILGERLRDWPGIIGETVGCLVLLIGKLAVLALVLYGLVRFVRWAWYN
jgi:hypothetical protein